MWVVTAVVQKHENQEFLKIKAWWQIQIMQFQKKFKLPMANFISPTSLQLNMSSER